MRKIIVLNRVQLFCITLTFVVLSVGCGSSGSSSSSTETTQTTSTVHEVDCSTITPTGLVVIQSFAFSPAIVTIGTGSIVKWTNNDPLNHTVTSGSSAAPEGFFDATLAPGASKCLQFTAAGSFGYYCKIHPSMTGTVMVQ